MLKDPDHGVRAVLGPTNTGKTHYAIERMLGHRNGVIGLPLRLLAREVYDRIVKLRGPSVVALITGEERIVPTRPAYWVATVEAMPLDIGAEFVAVDEIQLCADPERGHVFTDRLLNARGLSETLFLGSDTMAGRIAELIPRAEFRRRDRFSQLSYGGSRKISRMPGRSAIVGFSVEDVYAIAEVLRRLKGGAAVVMGALSPRTRNAQVEMYQNGDVEYLVATDAIGMGLNLDIDHVAFSGTVKFDGRRMRNLMPNELGQIAGRAGRYRTDGTFGVTGEVAALDAPVAKAIEDQKFAPIAKLQWRNSRLEFGTVDALIRSLEEMPQQMSLVRGREADDLATLRALDAMGPVRDMVRTAHDVRRIWDVCQVPDFRRVGKSEHAALAGELFGFLSGKSGRIPADYLAQKIERIDKVAGDIDTLSKRLAYVRTWTYVAQRKDWLDDSDYWRDETRRVEDRLSDALHLALTQRFVDRRTSLLMRRLKEKESLVAEVSKEGAVTVDGEFVGQLDGFRFRLDPKASAEEAKTLRQAAVAALAPEFSLRSDRMYNAPDSEFDVTEQGGLMWGNSAVGKLVKGAKILAPAVEVFVDDEAGSEVTEKVRRRLSHWVDRRITALFEPLEALEKDETLSGLAKGLGFQMVEALGVIPRGKVADDVRALDQDSRGMLRKHGVRFGQFTVFMSLLLKPAPTRMRLILSALWDGTQEFPSAPPPGLVTVPADAGWSDEVFAQSGYRKAGSRAIRIDMLERLADMIRAEDTRAGFEAGSDMLSITGLSHEQFADLMTGLGYEAERGERPKVRPVRPAAPAPAKEAETAAPDAAVSPEADAGEAKALAGEEVKTADADEAKAADAGEAKAAATEEVKPAAADEAPAADPTPEETAPVSDDASASATDAAPNDAPEIEVFYTFRRAMRKPRGGRPNSGEKPAGGRGKPQRQRQRGKGKPSGGPKEGGRERNFSARPPKKEKAIDPDNPFAALLALKDKS